MVWTLSSLSGRGLLFKDQLLPVTFELVLESLQAIYKGYTGNHFALIADDHFTKIQQKRFQKDFSIRTIPYKTSSKDHPQVADFLKLVRDSVKGEQATNTSPSEASIDHVAIQLVPCKVSL